MGNRPFPRVVRYIRLILLCSILLMTFPRAILAGEDEKKDVPNRYGLAPVIGYTYDPSDDIGFIMLSGFAVFDYDKIWPHAAPEALRFKVEASVGTTVTPEKDFMTSIMFFALYYIDRFRGPNFRPFIEGGIGGIYTDWQVDGQGSRVNFNPQIGIGTEFPFGTGPSFLAEVRLHHFSNGGLDDNNRGVNSVVFMLGRYF